MSAIVVSGLTFASYFVFSAAVGAMSAPTPEQEHGPYGWFYRFAQRLAANADKVLATRYPGLAAELAPPATGGISATHAEVDSISIAK